MIYSSDLFTYNAKYFQTLPREKCRSFTNSLCGMLKLVHEVAWQFAKKTCAWSCLANSTVHEVSWELNNLACRCGPICDRVISTIAFRSLFSSIRLSKRTELYWNSSKACFLNQTFTLCKILDRSCMKSCMWKRKKLQCITPGPA